MGLKEALITKFNTFFKWRKAKLVEALTQLRESYLKLHDKVKQLEQENLTVKILTRRARLLACCPQRGLTASLK